MALIGQPTNDPRVSREWWRTLRTYIAEQVNPLWAALRGENTDEIALANVTSINGVSAVELGTLDGLTATTAELNKLAGATPTTIEINKLSGLTPTTTELNTLSGITAGTGELNILDGVTAVAGELNKAVRTKSDGVAEASRNVVLDASKDLLGKRYDINQSLLSLITDAPHLHLDGNGDSVLLSDDGNFQFGSDDFSFVIVFRSNGKAEAQVLFSKRASGGLEAYLKTDGALLFYISDGTDTYSITTTETGFDDGDVHVVVGIADRDTELAIDIDGYQRDVTPAGTLANVDSVSESGTDLRLGAKPNGTDYELVGDLFQALFFNRVLAADERKAYASGAPPEFPDAGASQTALVIGDDSDMDTVGNWTGAGATVTGGYDSGDAGHSTTLRIEAIDGSSDRAELDGQFTLVAGKKYRLSFDYKHVNAVSCSSTGVTLYNGSSYTTLMAVTLSVGSWAEYSLEFTAANNEIRLLIYATDGATGAAANEMLVDNLTLVQIGCVAEYMPDGITHAQWQDASGNELHGTVNGPVPVNLPANHVSRHVKKGVTGDTVLSGVVPAGYRIKSIVVEESAGNAITGGLKIGTTAGGTQVVNGEAVGANALVDCALGSVIFSTSAAQSLYVEDVTAWNGASIDLWIQMERVV